MTAKKSEVWYVSQRGQLLAEQFLLELEPVHVSSLQQSDIGLDYLLFFSRKNGALQALGVEVVPTEREVPGLFTVDSSLMERLAGSNLPALLVVIDVKRSEIYFNWVEEAHFAKPKPSDGEPRKCTIELRKSSREEIEKLKREILSH